MKRVTVRTEITLDVDGNMRAADQVRGEIAQAVNEALHAPSSPVKKLALKHGGDTLNITVHQLAPEEI